MALFGAAYYRKWILALLVPLAGLWISDLLLNNIFLSQYYTSFQWIGNIWVYAAFGFIVLLGILTLKKVSVGKVIGVTLLSTLLFFILTNLGQWLSPFALHPRTGAGLLATYIDAIPFALNSVAGDLFYVGALFGSYAWMKSTYPQLQLEKANR